MQQKLKPSDVLNEIAIIFNKNVDEIVAKGRLEDHVMCRKICVYVCNELHIHWYRIALSINRTQNLVCKQLRTIKRHFRDNDSKWMEFWMEYEKNSQTWKKYKLNK